MSLFANVYTGANPNDGTGDSLRVAFQKIDQNFANIVLATSTSPVMNVAGRRGNIILYVNDIRGAASNAFVISQTNSANAFATSSIATALSGVNELVDAANTAAYSYTNSAIASATAIVANVSALNANIGNLYANVGGITRQLANIGDGIHGGLLYQYATNINTLSNTVANLTSSTSTLQSNSTVIFSTLSNVIANTSAAISTANTGMKSYVDAGKTTLNTAITTANTGLKNYVDSHVNATNDAVTTLSILAQSTQDGLVITNNHVSDLQSNAAIQEIEISSIRANIVGVEGDIITANSGVVSYVNTLNSAVTAKINAANTAIVTANTSLKSYTDLAISTAINNLINSAPGTLDTLGEIAANLAQEGSAITAITNSITNTNANVTAANAAIVTANTAMKSYVDAVTTAWTANAVTQAGALAVLIANAASQDSALSTLSSNAVIQSGRINTVNANVAGANAAIITANTAMKLYVDTNITGVYNAIAGVNANIGTQTVYLTNFAANVQGNVQDLANAVTSANSAITTANTGVVSYVNSLNAAMAANIRAANLLISTNSNSIATINTTLNTVVGNLTTGPLNITGNVQFGNVRTNGTVTASAGVVFGDGSRQTTAVQPNTGNIVFTNTTLSTANAAGSAGITLTPANGGEIHINSYTGINNTNPGYWLHVGDGSSGAVNNTGNISIDFNNGVDTARGSAILDWAWWDAASRGNNNRGTGPHTHFGIYKNDDTHNTKFIEFDYASGNVSLGNVAFTMANSQHWTSNVTTISAALNQLAARLKAAGF